MRSRVVQLQLFIRDLAQAQERYYLANGVYTDDFDSLDIDFPNMPLTSFSVYTWTVTSKKGNDNFGLTMGTNYGRVLVFFRSGQYAGGALVYFLVNQTFNIGTLQKGQTYCIEGNTPNFCTKAMGITAAPVAWNGGTYYPLP